jgi:hypothetical protein
MVKVWFVIVLKGLQLEINGLIQAVLKAGSCIWPLMWQSNGITITQGQER